MCVVGRSRMPLGSAGVTRHLAAARRCAAAAEHAQCLRHDILDCQAVMLVDLFVGRRSAEALNAHDIAFVRHPAMPTLCHARLDRQALAYTWRQHAVTILLRLLFEQLPAWEAHDSRLDVLF